MLEVEENTSGAIHRFSASDADGDAVAWSLSGDGAASFAIDENMGALSVASGAVLDYESGNQSHALVVTADDGEGGTDSVAVTVRIANVAEPPDALMAPVVTGLSANSLRVAWSAPDTSGQGAIEGYEMRYCATSSDCGADSDWRDGGSVAANLTGTVIDGLAPDTAYEVQVRARNAEGSGDWSASGQGRTRVPGLALSAQSVTVTESDAANSEAYTVQLGARPGGVVTVAVTSDDTSVATVSPATLTFTLDDWNSPRTVIVTGVDDAVDNDGRGTVVRHRASGGGYDTANEAVLDVALVDDEEVSVSIEPVTAPEGDAGVSEWAFEVNLSTASASQVRVDWTTSDGTAFAGEDYAAASGTLRIAPGGTSGTILVSVHGDRLAETDEHFLVSLTAAMNAQTGSPTARGTILDDDLQDSRGDALEGMLAGLGRTLGADAVGAVTGRLRGAANHGGCGPSSDGGTGGGKGLPALGDLFATPGSSMRHMADTRGLGSSASPTGERFGGMSFGGRVGASMDGQAHGRTGASAGGQSGGDFKSVLWGMLPREFGTRVGTGEGGDGACGGGLGIWGRITTSTFGGREMDGQLHTGYLGVDRRFGDNVLAGLALTHSLSDLDSRPPGARADVSLTSVLPYGRVETGAGSVWGLLGVGWGGVDLTDGFGDVGTDLSMRLAGAGWRRPLGLAGPGGLRLAVKGDAVASWLSADGVEGELAEADAEAQRVRLLIEGTLELSSSDTSATSLRLDAGGRWDGGTAAGGGGVELDLSLVHRQPDLGLEVSADGRYTVLHGADRFEDGSLSLAVSLDPGERGRGLRLSLAPTWGAAGGGAMSWLQAEAGAAMAPGMMGGGSMMPGPAGGSSSWRGWRPGSYQAELGYGWLHRNGRPLDLYSAMTRGGSNAVWRFGGRMTLSAHLGLGLELTRTERPGAPPEHAIQLRFGNAAGTGLGNNSMNMQLGGNDMDAPLQGSLD